jgi:hypothetical protein
VPIFNPSAQLEVTNVGIYLISFQSDFNIDMFEFVFIDILIVFVFDKCEMGRKQ